MASGNISLSLSPDPNLSNLCVVYGHMVGQERTLAPSVIVTKWICISLLVSTCPFSVLLNLLVVVAVQHKRYLRRKLPHVLLACLACTDLLTGALTQPLQVITYLQHLLGLGSVCFINILSIMIHFLSVGASLFHLVIISGERYVAIKHALRYQTLVTTRRIGFAVASAWLLPGCGFLIVSSLALFGARDYMLAFLSIGTFVTLSICLFTISFFQFALLHECRRHRKHIRNHSVSKSSARELLQKHKAAKTTSIIVIALALCFLPQIVFYGVVLPMLKPCRSVVLSAVSIIDVLVALNSLINPVIYCARTEAFRRAFREILSLKNSETNVRVETDDSTSGRRWRARVSPLMARDNSWRHLKTTRTRSHSQETRLGSRLKQGRFRANSC